MTKFNRGSFSEFYGSKKYRENFERMFKSSDYGACPKCGEVHPQTTRERRPNGFTKCGECGAKVRSVIWDEAQDG